MGRKHKQPRVEPMQKLKRSTLAIGLVVGLAFSIIMGVTGGAIGLGALYPQLNLITKPFVCPGGQMSYSQQVSVIGTASYHTAKWFCQDATSGEKREIDGNTIFLTAGLFYGTAFFAVLLLITYLYWNSSIGPARNGGPRLW
jgi:hypothetical protein